MPIARIDGLDVYYEVGGAGPRLLYLSGTNGDLRRANSPFNSPLADGFELLSFDQRGLGRTDKPDAPYSMAGYGDDAAGLLDHLGWPDCAVIGVSFGGMVAQELALRHPGRVAKLVLCCTSAGGAGGSSFPLHTLSDLGTEEMARHGISRNDIRRDDAWRRDNPEDFAKMLEDAIAAIEFHSGEPGREIGQRRQLEARRHHDTHDRLGGLALPVLVCGGRHDGQAEPRVVENLAARIPGARLEFFDGGHMFLHQDAKAFAAISDFLL